MDEEVYDKNTPLTDDDSDTDSELSFSHLNNSADDLCSKLNSDEDFTSTRIFTEVDVLMSSV